MTAPPAQPPVPAEECGVHQHGAHRAMYAGPCAPPVPVDRPEPASISATSNELLLKEAPPVPVDPTRDGECMFLHQHDGSEGGCLVLADHGGGACIPVAQVEAALRKITEDGPAHYFDCDRFEVYHGTRQGTCDCTFAADLAAAVAAIKGADRG